MVFPLLAALLYWWVPGFPTHHTQRTDPRQGTVIRARTARWAPRSREAFTPDWRPAGAPPPPTVSEPEGLLVVYGQSEPLWSRRPNAVGPIASTTKLMTAYLAAAALPVSERIVVSPAAAATGGSDILLRPGMVLTTRQLLYALLLRSANDAAVALAQAVSGNVPAFVTLMNETARTLGMTHTHYADPDGLSPASQSSATDLVRLAQVDLRNPLLATIMTTPETSLPLNPVVPNIDGFVLQDPAALGLKTGWTSQAGTCLVFAARQDVAGRPVTLVGALLHGTTFPPEYHDAEALLAWGFRVIRPAVVQLARAHRLPNLNP